MEKSLIPIQISTGTIVRMVQIGVFESRILDLTMIPQSNVTTIQPCDLGFEKYLLRHGFPRDLMKPETGVFVCGGVWRSYYTEKHPNDIDIFCSSIDRIQECRRILESQGHKAIYETYKAILYNKSKAPSWNPYAVPIHLVLKVHGKTMIDTLNSFDFNICMFGTDFQKDGFPIECPLSTFRSNPGSFLRFFNPLRVNRWEGALSMISHAMRLREGGFRLKGCDFLQLIRQASIESDLLRAVGTDPLSVMESY